MKTRYTLGIDVGSTTVKMVVLDEDGSTLYQNYVRHASKVKETALLELKEILEKLGDIELTLSFTGSAGLGLSERAGLPFVQEVESAFRAIKELYPNVDASIELGGEDAKIIFITGGVEERMNGSCAGGTGAFIDQMATLLNVSLPEMDELSLKAEKAYPIASRCGVFAKSDVQAILNQGDRKEDVALSIFYAVADQTIAGLAQGREIKGNILFLGGPLHFLKGLGLAFKNRLKLDDEHAIFPKDSDTFMAKGAAIFARKNGASPMKLKDVIAKIEGVKSVGDLITGKPLFNSEAEYQDFLSRHKDFDVKRADLSTYVGKAYLGIDEGSTTTKIVLLSEKNEILYSHYEPNNGLPIDKIVNQLKTIYNLASPGLEIVSSAVTGYGEDLIKASLHVDYGLVETVAHFKAAKYFAPNVDFILDIGGQDIKCFRIKSGAIDSIMLNEACSSGCGSFLSSFALALGYDVETFSRIGYFAKNPVELGSRCTVFMNSSVKQSQRDGASIEDISAGLSRSVVKNALYKVIRVHSAKELGETIVCQGGTFLNNAVLRSFEQEIGHEVIRPSIAGLMGAFGAALYAKERGGAHKLICKEELEGFSYSTRHAICQGCTAHCNLTVLNFGKQGVFISGNKCEKGEGKKAKPNNLDIYAYKRKRLLELSPEKEGAKLTVGLPLSLLMYEQLPLWDAFFKELGFKTLISPFSSRHLYRKGQKSIPSDTACYPAKLMHGHAAYLFEHGADFIFYPSESYNVDERRGSNHFNCPVVAYYGELLKRNDSRLNSANFLDPFVDLNSPKKAIKSLSEALKGFGVKEKDVEKAFAIGLKAYQDYRLDVKKKGQEIIEEARKEGKEIVVLAGRPYHLDPEVNHGIDKLLDSLDVALISEDALDYSKMDKAKTEVLNQWTYHARLFDAAKYVSEVKDMELIQLISFGCGVDAITSDEVRRILEEKNRLYTGLKIDEISNLGAVRIRIRSLLAAIEEKRRMGE
ncbi:MAG: 2-hydroxyacyl-CoA dehydratase [Bacilli bacterium]|nr:2-hydroxyacyl-CoA dehydratase [Bacilli bacterium]